MRRRPLVAALLAAMSLAASASHADEQALPPPASPTIGACGTGGGFLLPGADGCLKIGGFVRAEGFWRSAPSATFAVPQAGLMTPIRSDARDLGRSALGGTARLTADLRIPTELGPFRVFVSLRGHNGAATDRLAR